MKVSASIDLDRSRQEVWERFDSFENLKLWQPTLISHEPVSGEPGQVGAVTNLTYEEDGRKVVLIETILVRDEPNKFSGTYEAQGVLNTIQNRFSDLEGGRTRWDLESEFKFLGWYRFMSVFMGRFFRKRTEEQMLRFKTLVEQDAA